MNQNKNQNMIPDQIVFNESVQIRVKLSNILNKDDFAAEIFDNIECTLAEITTDSCDPFNCHCSADNYVLLRLQSYWFDLPLTKYYDIVYSINQNKDTYPYETVKNCYDNYSGSNIVWIHFSWFNCEKIKTDD